MKEIKNKKSLLQYFFLGFFVLMLILTILSRMLDSVMIPKVEVSSAASGNLEYLVQGYGVVKAAEAEYLTLPRGFRAKAVLPVGQRVEEGDTVVFLSLDGLEEKKKEIGRAIQKMELSLERERLSGKTPDRISEQELLTGEALQAQKDLVVARIALQKAQDNHARVLEELKKKRERERNLEGRRFSLSKEEVDKLDQVSGNQVEKDYSQAELAYSIAIAQVEETYEASLKSENEKWEAALLQAGKDVDAYNRMQVQAGLAVKTDETVKKNQQTAARISDKNAEMIQVDLSELQEAKQKIDKLIQENGAVKAQTDGTITQMGITPGMMTTGEEIIEIGSKESFLTAGIRQEDSGILKEGDGIGITMPMVTNEVKGTILTIGVQAGDKDMEEGGMEFTAQLAEGEYQIGSRAEFMVKKSSQMRYACLIPLSAVRQDAQGDYCLIAEKQATVLGEEEIAARIPIRVIKADTAHAAIDAVINPEDRIIVGSNKMIAEGDRVRIQP